MIPIKFEGMNRLFVHPGSMTEDQCGALPALATEIDGHPYIVSCWQPSDEEIAYIIENKRIFVGVNAEVPTPIFLIAHNTFDHGGPKFDGKEAGREPNTGD